MVIYECTNCNFLSKLKGDYKRHLNTKKHMTKIKDNGVNNKKKHEIPSISLNFPQKSLNFPQFPSLKDETYKNYNCEFCGNKYSRKDNLIRHQTTNCRNKYPDFKDLFYEMKNEFEKEKKEFRKNIELLIHKVGNTTINNTQNIQLNSYGNEDLSHISDTLKTQLLKGPYSMIPKLIEAVHFNDNKPENKNILLTNKNDNKIKVFSGNKWIYKNKNETLNKLVDGKYFILDTHFENMCNKLEYKNKNIYDKFRTIMDEGDRKLIEQLKQDCELVLLNNR